MALFDKHNPDGHEKPFNMDWLFLERVNMRLNELDLATNAGEQLPRYRILHTIFINTHFKYTDKVDEIKKEFLGIKELLKAQAGGISKSSLNQHYSVVISSAEILLDDLHLKLVSLLYEHELIYLKARDYKGVDVEVADDY